MLNHKYTIPEWFARVISGSNFAILSSSFGLNGLEFNFSIQLLQPADVLIEDVIHRFYTSMERFYSSEELAEEYALSPRSLSSRFKKETGSSIHQYQIHLKLEMAYDLIPFSPGRSFRDIALSLGFYDEFQFSKLFKRQYGITPSARR